MFLVLYDLKWMSYNLVLAIIPVIFGWLILRAKNRIYRIFSAICWLVFLPNTIYLLTDIIHLSDDWERPIDLTSKFIIASMYIALLVIGIFTFVLSLHPIEKLFKRKMHHRTLIIVGVNFLIGFGMVLGRIERTNSWEIVTNTPKVIWDTLRVLTSPEKLILFIIFGVLCNVVYFSCRKAIMNEVHEIENL